VRCNQAYSEARRWYEHPEEERDTSPNEGHEVLDQLAIGDGKGMDSFSSVYDRFDEMYQENRRFPKKKYMVTFLSERLLRDRLRDDGVSRFGGPSWLQWATYRGGAYYGGAGATWHGVGGSCGVFVAESLNMSLRAEGRLIVPGKAWVNAYEECARSRNESRANNTSRSTA